MHLCPDSGRACAPGTYCVCGRLEFGCEFAAHEVPPDDVFALARRYDLIEVDDLDPKVIRQAIRDAERANRDARQTYALPRILPIRHAHGGS